MTVEEAIKQAIRCAVGGCSEDCPYCDSDNVCHASEGFAENLENALSEFRELKEKATAKKPKKVVGYGMFDCPHCNTVLPIGKKYPHCTWCGGLIDYDWSKGKE